MSSLLLPTPRRASTLTVPGAFCFATVSHKGLVKERILVDPKDGIPWMEIDTDPLEMVALMGVWSPRADLDDASVWLKELSHAAFPSSTDLSQILHHTDDDNYGVWAFNPDTRDLPQSCSFFFLIPVFRQVVLLGVYAFDTEERCWVNHRVTYNVDDSTRRGDTIALIDDYVCFKPAFRRFWMADRDNLVVHSRTCDTRSVHLGSIRKGSLCGLVGISCAHDSVRDHAYVTVTDGKMDTDTILLIPGKVDETEMNELWLVSSEDGQGMNVMITTIGDSDVSPHAFSRKLFKTFPSSESVSRFDTAIRSTLREEKRPYRIEEYKRNTVTEPWEAVGSACEMRCATIQAELDSLWIKVASLRLGVEFT